MKRVLHILGLLFCCIDFCSAQAYRPFLNDSAHWTMTTHECQCDPGNPQPTDCSITTTYSYKLDGEQIINGFVYKYLSQSIVSIVSPKNSVYCGHSTFTPCQDVALLREDTVARKVYIKNGWCSQDTLLYDFSMQISDSMKFNASCPSNGIMDSLYQVDSINYSLFGSSSVRTWYLHHLGLNSNFSNLKLYESIGSSAGFWGFQLNFDEGQLENDLVNYCIGSDSACGFSCENPLLGIRDPSLQNDFISIYPNPTKDFLTMELGYIPLTPNLQFELTNLLGQTIYRKAIAAAKTEMDIADFPSGLYLWHLLSGSNLIKSGKVVHE